MRQLHGHEVNPVNATLMVAAMDAPGSGGASHKYMITGFKHPNKDEGDPDVTAAVLHFQNGPIGEAGVNGITHEALLTILIDRLRSFQAGPYKGRENAIALTHLEDAQHWLHARTRERMARNVEGTHNV